MADSGVPSQQESPGPGPPSVTPSGPRTVGRKLAAQRHRLFVGRGAELDLLSRALQSAPGAGTVFYIYGPGGVGKSALLRQYARLAAEAGRRVQWVDGRTTEASPQAFLAAIAQGEQRLLSSTAAPPQPDPDGNTILLIDTYELLTPLDDWLRETYLPQLPERAVVIIAGRGAPSPGWRTDLA